MAKRGHIKPGYKPTPLGPIPIDWGIKVVGEAFIICNGLRFPISEEERQKIKGVFPYYGPTKIQDYINSYRVDGMYSLIGEDGDHFLKWRQLPMTLLVEGKFNVNNHAHLIKGEDNLTEWFFYFFNHKELTPYLTRQGAGRYKLTKDALTKIPMILPPLDEQISITALLSTWDKAITKCVHLITQKEVRKNALTQKLLTGRKRLKGFREKWKYERISTVAIEVSIKNIDNKTLTVLSCTKYDGLVPSLEYFGRRIYSADLSTYKVVPKSHFAYATNHIEEGSIGYQADFEKGLISPMYTIFKTKAGVNDDFLFRLLKSHQYIHQYQKRMEGSIDRRGGLRWDEFSKIKIPILNKDEQDAISSLFKTTDKELQLLNQKLEKLKEQKKGLMQVLLTGKKRLNQMNVKPSK